jgi:hypothetical protein
MEQQLRNEGIQTNESKSEQQEHEEQRIEKSWSVMVD